MRHLAIVTAIVAYSALPFMHADSVLNFPRATLVQNQFTGFAIANPTDTDAEVTLTAYRSDGTPFASPGVTNPAKLNIPAHQQKAFLLGDPDIFGIPLAVVNSVEQIRLWIQATSPLSGLTGFYLLGDTSLHTLDGSDPSGGLTDALFLLIDESTSAGTDLKIVNPGESPAAITVEYRRANGTIASTASLPPLAPKAALQGKPSELFANQPSDTAYIRFKSDSALGADALAQNTQGSDAAVLSAQRSVAQSRILNFPQLAEGGDWFSEITVVNVSDKTIIATFRALQENGSLFVPPALTNNTVQQALRPGALFRRTAAEIFGFRQDVTQAGWLQVEGSDLGLTGYIAYGTRTTSMRAIVAAQHVPVARAVFSHQAEAAGFFTGLAVLNASAFTANVELYSLNADGSLRGSTKQALKPNQRESKLMRQWVAAAQGAAGGYILLRSDVPVIATELFGTGAALANVPPQPITSDPSPAPNLAKLKVFPPLAVVETKSTQQFQAQGITDVTWSVDVQGGGSAAGSVNTTSGVYTAPDKPPQGHTVSLIATSADRSQNAGASVDIIERKTLAGGLSVVRAVAYLSGSKRFFLAEQQAAGKNITSGGPTKISELIGSTAQLVTTINETVEKMLPFTDRRGRETLLLAGFDSGTIYRFDPAAPQQPAVALITGLSQPTSMAFTETGDLAVAEQGANQIQIFPRERFEPAKTGAPGVDRRSIATSSPQGVAVDSCTGEIFYTDLQGNVTGILSGQTRLLASGLRNPSELLAVRRGGTRCPFGLTLFVAETGANQIRMIVPDSGQSLVFLGNLRAPNDIALLPPGNNLADDVNEASISIADRSSVQQAQVGKLYTPQAEPVIPTVDPGIAPGKVTVSVTGSGKMLLQEKEPAPSQISFSVSLNLTFTGVTLVNSAYLQNGIFDTISVTEAAFGTVSGTITASGSVVSGSVATVGPLFNGTLAFNGQKVGALIDRQRGVLGLANFYPNVPAPFDHPERVTTFGPQPGILGMLLTGADLKTVDVIGLTVAPRNLFFFFRKGSIVSSELKSDEVLSSESNFTVTIK